MRHDDQAPDDEGRSGAEKGQIIILFAMFSTVLIGMLGLAMDLGFAFSQKRTVQNAADAAALAGARQVAHYKADKPTEAQTDANHFATEVDANKMTETQSMPVCQYIDDTFKAPPDATLNIPCTSYVPFEATGVHVEVKETHETFFIRVLAELAPDPEKLKRIDITAQAAARVEVLRDLPTDGSFILCGSHAWAVKDRNDNDISGQGITKNIFLPTSPPVIDPEAVGFTYVVRDNNIGTGPASGTQPKTLAGCDTPDGWKGMALGSGNVSTSTPGWFDYHTGTQVGVDFTPVRGVGGCIPPKYTGCVMYLPVAIDTPSPTTSPEDKQIWVVGLAPFYLTSVGNNDQEIRGKLVDNFIASGPSDAGWDRDKSDKPVVIRMIQ